MLLLLRYKLVWEASVCGHYPVNPKALQIVVSLESRKMFSSFLEQSLYYPPRKSRKQGISKGIGVLKECQINWPAAFPTLAFSNLSTKESICILAIVSYPQFLMSSCHSYNTVLQIQTIIVVFSSKSKSCPSNCRHFFLSSFSRCDCCDGPMFGPGVRVIKAPSVIFGVRNLPFVFNACTQTCRRQFSRNPDSLKLWMQRNSPQTLTAL